MKQILPFQESKNKLTLGIEIELQVLDKNTLLLTPRAHEIIDLLPGRRIKHEFFQSTLEVITGICRDVHEAKVDLSETLVEIKNITKGLGLQLSSTGTHPEADYRDRLVTPSKRYHALLDRNQWIIRRMAVYGMHIHIGMPSGDECIRFQNFFLHFVPHVLALSASSPFWQRINTGLAASRPTMYEAMPTSGMPHIVKTWHGFEKMYREMVRAKSIKSMRDLWLDLRPSPDLGTLEIRVCDEPATLSEALAITAFVHTLAYWYQENQVEWEMSHKKLYSWIFRENKWRAIRHGLNGDLIQSNVRKTQTIRENIEMWIEKLNPWIKQFGYDQYFATLEDIIKQGNSSERQVAVFQESKDLHDVIKHNTGEFERGFPKW